MPGRDGTGPLGTGSIIGRGLGFCTIENAAKLGTVLGLGLGCRYGFGHGFNRNRNNNISQSSPNTQKELLQEQKDMLQNRLQVIDKQLENL